ncbi:MAG: DUF4912 domain-containing protein [Cyanobacteriota bacterium]|nr:DUF4912 domain-containing protein [Cyanobacteriota bacterium]
MAFPEINNSSDRVSDNAPSVNQATDVVRSTSNVSQQNTAEVIGTDTINSESSLPDNESWIVLELHNPENLYTHWNIIDADRERLRQQGGRQFALRFYDVTFIDMDVQKPHSVQEYECEESTKEFYIHVPMKERDYIVEIGYVTEAGRWLKLVRSSHIHFPWDFPWPEEPPEPMDETEEDIEEETEVETEPDETPESKEKKRITDVEPLQVQSSLDPVPTEDISIDEVPTPVEAASNKSPSDRPSPAIEPTEANLDSDNQLEISVVKNPVTPTATDISSQVPGTQTESKAENQVDNKFSDQEIQSNIAATKFNLGQSDTIEKLAAVDEGLTGLPGGYGETKIVLLPVDPDWIYVYWDIPNEDREKRRQQGGKQLGLRVYDVTEVDLDTQKPHSVEYHECDELAREWHIQVPMSDRDYLVEIGYLTQSKRWLMLARSLHVRVPPVYPSDREDYHQRTVTWDENLRGKFFFSLRSFLTEMTQSFQNPFLERFS